MSDYEDLRQLVQQALPPVETRSPDRDLWPAVREHRAPAPDWTWLDLGAVVAAMVLLALFPESLWLLLFNL